MQGRKVLIIDDEIDLCLLLKSYFQKKGFEVHLSHTAEEGRRSIGEITPDIIFLDNNLPDGTGWDMVPEIVQNHPEVSVNLISAFHAELPKQISRDRYNVIEKPVSLSYLDKLFS